MMYLSQLLGKSVYHNTHYLGKLVDMAINEHEQQPSISRIEIKKGKKLLVTSAENIQVLQERVYLTSDDLSPLSKDQHSFYLSQDLLDKQVIDIDGKRLVRVNDVLLDGNHQLIVAGIDIGFSGILRRLGLGKIKIADKILPWRFIEAFDYDTGNIRIRLAHNSLNTFHPSEIADILEDVGTKERLGIVSSLDAKQAAQAIEESDEETQVSILEGLSTNALKEVLNKMHSSEIADVFHDVNPVTLEEIQTILGSERVKKVKGLLKFSDDDAGGLMHDTFFTVSHDTSISKITHDIHKLPSVPETIVVNNNGLFLGSFSSRELLKANDSQVASDLITNTKSLYPEDSFSDIIDVFAHYNLRGLPIINSENKAIGIVLIDDVIKSIEEENQKDETH